VAPRRALTVGERMKRGWDTLLELLSSTGGAHPSFKGAEVSRIRPGQFGLIRGADREIEWDLRLLRGRARALRRNNPYIENYLNLQRTNVLGPEGPEQQAQVRNAGGELEKEINDRIEAAWRAWSEGPVSVDGQMNLAMFRQLALETATVDGEAFTLPVFDTEFPHGLALDSIDADLVDERMWRMAGSEGPEVRMGVEVNERGRPLAYYCWDYPEYGPGRTNRGRLRYDAADVLHHFRRRRAHQTRGVTRFTAAIVDTMDLDGFEEAVIVGARAAANQVAAIESGDAAMYTAPEEDAPTKQPAMVESEAGMYLELQPGQKMSSFTPEQPQSVYDPFVRNRLRRLAGALGVAYEALANDRSGVNYGSMRGGSLIERDLWRLEQAWWAWTFERPIRERWLQSALASGALVLPSRDWRKYSAVKLVFRGWPWVDPLKDAQTAQLEIEMGFNSRTRILAQRGADFAEILDELAAEQKAAAAKGVDVEPRATAAPAEKEPADEDGGAGDESEDGGNGNGRAHNRVRKALARGR
jgi:lambda family phage portal protein